MDFIKTAEQNGNFVVARLFESSERQLQNSREYELKYQYFVDEKPYYIVYKLYPSYYVEGEGLPPVIYDSLVLYYDNKKPEKAYAKQEIFTEKRMFTRSTF